MKFISLLCFLCAAFAFAGGAQADTSVLRCVSDTGPCVIHGNGGGYVNDFIAAAEEIKAQKRQVVIDGECDSACTIFADLARPYVCITANAWLGFHLATEIRTEVFNNGVGRFSRQNSLRIENYVDPARYYSPDIREWIGSHNGLLPNGELTMMSAGVALNFWPVCGEKTAAK